MTTATMTLPHGNSHPKDLRTIFQFTDADLKANANGEMTDSQLERMQRDQLMSLRWSVGIFWGMVAAFWGIFAFIMMSSGYDLRDDVTIAMILLGGFVGLPLIFLAYSFYMIWQYYQTKDDVDVAMVDGKLNKRSYRIKRSTFYELHIGGYKFDTNEGVTCRKSVTRKTFSRSVMRFAVCSYIVCIKAESMIPVNVAMTIGSFSRR
jgi:hypothetical protein